jgi:hypothetical protein
MSRERHKRCLGCGYILDGLPENRCPECGRAFDPSDLRTYLSKTYSGRPFLALAIVFASLWAIGVTVSLLEDAGIVELTGWPQLLLGLVMLGFLGGAYSLGQCVDVLRRPVHATQHRSALIAATLISAIVVGGFVGLLLVSEVLR